MAAAAVVGFLFVIALALLGVLEILWIIYWRSKLREARQ